METSKLRQKLVGLCLTGTAPFRTRHSAVITFKGRPIAWGVNSDKTHPLALEFSKNEHAVYLHAEIDALVKALRLVESKVLSNCRLTVCRVWKDGSLANSCPCDGCRKAVEAYGLKLSYSTREGWYDQD